VYCINVCKKDRWNKQLIKFMKTAEINEDSQQLKLILTKQKDEALKGRFFFDSRNQSNWKQFKYCDQRVMIL